LQSSPHLVAIHPGRHRGLLWLQLLRAIHTAYDSSCVFPPRSQNQSVRAVTRQVRRDHAKARRRVRDETSATLWTCRERHTHSGTRIQHALEDCAHPPHSELAFFTSTSCTFFSSTRLHMAIVFASGPGRDCHRGCPKKFLFSREQLLLKSLSCTT
jgi:hypothetical protein